MVKLNGGALDDQLKDQFNEITRTILSNQTESLRNLTDKVTQAGGAKDIIFKLIRDLRIF